MKQFFLLCGLFLMILIQSQDIKKGHYNESLYKELDSELPTPNMFRTASGAPGSEYYQQKADYVMDIILDDENQILYGEETITYHNYSPDKLEYLWVQLDQNTREPNEENTALKQTEKAPKKLNAKGFSRLALEPPFPGGFQLEFVKDSKGKALSYTINNTMMRINLEKALLPGEVYSFSIKWKYNINNYLINGGRSGYEHFEEDNNNLYVIAQFFPRMAVYNDVEGWQNMQFWGRSEFALPFGDYKVNITVPADHIMNGTGEITNLKSVLNVEQYKRWEKALNTYDNPVMIVTEAEARLAEKSKSRKTKTWKFEAKNVRDFGFSSSRKFIFDAMAVQLHDKKVMAISLYPKEGNPLWEKYSTRVVAHTLKEYSKMTFDYPYPKAISVHADRQGMEYPMICWNYGRPDKDGTYSEATKHGMISVIIHEIGHNFFPMIVNSDERQWTWMDEGLNTFLQFVAEQNMPLSFPEYTFDKNYPSRRGFAKDIVNYMSMNQEELMPIMTQGDHVFNFGANAYGKPATALAILRETIMGREQFDYAFKTYANRWKFKHPTPADFFRTMEDASAVDLDWFWRGWFYTTNYTDIGIKNVKQMYLKENGEELGFTEEVNSHNFLEYSTLKEYLQSLEPQKRAELKNPKYFYEITYEKPGQLIMPIIVSFEFEDGSKQNIKYPYMIWRLHENRDITKFYAFDKKLKRIVIDEQLETADINLDNNIWQEK